MRVDFRLLEQVVKGWVEESLRSMIKPTLHRRTNNWYRLQFVEVYEDDQNNRLLDGTVKWTEEKLKDWPDVERMAWDMWDFKHRHDAEKFITLFHLSWTR